MAKSTKYWVLAGIGLALVGGTIAVAATGGKKPSGQLPQSSDRGYTIGPGCQVIVTNESLALKYLADLGSKALSWDDAMKQAIGCPDWTVKDKSELPFLYKFRYALERALLGAGVMSVVEFQERVAESRVWLETNGVSLEGLPGSDQNGFSVTPDCVITVSDETLAILWSGYVAATTPWDEAVATVYSGCNPSGQFGDPAVAPFLYRTLHAMLTAAIGQGTRTVVEANGMLTVALEMMKAADIDAGGLPGLFES